MDGSLPNALIAAVRAGDVLEVRRILRGYGGRRVDLNQLDMFGNTALHWAVTSEGEGGTEIARLLIQAGAKVNVPNEENQTPLLRACRLGRHDTVDALLDADAVVTGTDSEGGTALMKAAYGGLDDIIERLIERGAQHALLDQNKRTALHHAARSGHPDAIRVLVRVGAEIDQRDIQDWTPLMHAADQGHAAACQALVEAGANPLLVCDTQNVALDFAWDFEARRTLRLAMKRAKRAAEMLEEQERQKQQAHLQRQQQREAAADRTVRDSLRDDNPNSISRKLRDCFDRVSADASLSIGCGEFAQAAALMGREFASDAELQDVMQELDSSGDGSISFSEFRDWWISGSISILLAQDDSNGEGTTPTESFFFAFDPLAGVQV